MRQVQRHAEGNNLVLLEENLEGKRLVALVAINNEQHIATHSLLLHLLNRALQPGQPNLIRSPAILADPNTPLRLSIGLPGRIVVLCFEDEVGCNCPGHRVDACDESHPLTVSLLHAWLSACTLP